MEVTQGFAFVINIATEVCLSFGGYFFIKALEISEADNEYLPSFTLCQRVIPHQVKTDRNRSRDVSMLNERVESPFFTSLAEISFKLPFFTFERWNLTLTGCCGIK